MYVLGAAVQHVRVPPTVTCARTVTADVVVLLPRTWWVCGGACGSKILRNAELMSDVVEGVGDGAFPWPCPAGASPSADLRWCSCGHQSNMRNSNMCLDDTFKYVSCQFSQQRGTSEPIATHLMSAVPCTQGRSGLDEGGGSTVVGQASCQGPNVLATRTMSALGPSITAEVSAR